MPMNSCKPLFLKVTASIAAMLFLALTASDASAKKKRLLFGCNTGQIQSTSCDVGTLIHQDGKYYTKVLMCDSGGHTLCCVADMNSKIIDGTCHTLTLTATPPTDAAPRPGKFEQSTKPPNPNGRVTTTPGLLEQNNGSPGGQGPSPTGSPPGRAGAPSFQ